MEKIHINITVKHAGIGLKIFDYLNAAGIRIFDRPLWFTINHADQADLRILFVRLQTNIDLNEIEQHDLIFFSNNDEPLDVLDHNIVKWIHLPKSYLICNSFTHPSHDWHSKIIWASNDALLTRQYWTNAMFPIYHSHQRSKHRIKKQNMVFINGQNRSWRQHYVTKLGKEIPTLPIVNNFSTFIDETNVAKWETCHDTEFREFVNSHYNVCRNQKTDYYTQSIKMDLLGPYDGLPHEAIIPPGYFFLPEYYDYKCIVFPESDWLNNQICPTEKILKCFFSKTLPFPIGGARVNQLYNSLGFVTAWNLLPSKYQNFDDELSHIVRTDQIVDAVKWLYQNPTVFTSDEYLSAVNTNYVQFLENNIDPVGVDTVVKILQQILNDKILI